MSYLFAFDCVPIWKAWSIDDPSSYGIPVFDICDNLKIAKEHFKGFIKPPSLVNSYDPINCSFNLNFGSITHGESYRLRVYLIRSNIATTSSSLYFQNNAIDIKTNRKKLIDTNLYKNVKISYLKMKGRISQDDFLFYYQSKSIFQRILFSSHMKYNF